MSCDADLIERCISCLIDAMNENSQALTVRQLQDIENLGLAAGGLLAGRQHQEESE